MAALFVMVALPAVLRLKKLRVPLGAVLVMMALLALLLSKNESLLLLVIVAVLALLAAKNCRTPVSVLVMTPCPGRSCR